MIIRNLHIRQRIRLLVIKRRVLGRCVRILGVNLSQHKTQRLISNSSRRDQLGYK